MQKIGDSTITANAEGEYTEGNPAAGVDATQLKAAWLNAIQRELVAVVAGAGIALDPAQDNQVLSAIRTLLRKGSGAFAADTGVANAYAATYSPAITALTDGLALRFQAANANSGASTFSPDGLLAAPIVGCAHSALQGGEIIVGGDVWVQWNSSIGGGAWVLIDSTGGAMQVANGSKSHHAVALGQIATEVLAGVLRVASPAEILAGTAADRAVSPLGLLTTFLGTGGIASNDYIKIPFRDKTSGVRRELIIQWIRSTTLGGQGATSNFPIAFPNACCGVWGASVNGASPQTISVGSASNTGFAAWGGTVPSGFGAIAIGY